MPKPPPPDPRQVVEASFLAAAADAGQLPPPALVELAFAGRSNVGKSSLMNALVQRHKLVRTSSTPGCTRTVSFFATTCRDGAQMTLVDLPGYGYAQRSRMERNAWAELIENYLLERPSLRVVSVLVDIRRELEDDDRHLLEMLKAPPRTQRPKLEVVLVATKLDRLAMKDRKLRLTTLEQVSGQPVFAVSVEDAASIRRLWQRLRQLAGVEVPPPPREFATKPGQAAIREE